MQQSLADSLAARMEGKMAMAQRQLQKAADRAAAKRRAREASSEAKASLSPHSLPPSPVGWAASPIRASNSRGWAAGVAAGSGLIMAAATDTAVDSLSECRPPGGSCQSKQGDGGLGDCHDGGDGGDRGRRGRQ